MSLAQRSECVWACQEKAGASLCYGVSGCPGKPKDVSLWISEEHLGCAMPMPSLLLSGSHLTLTTIISGGHHYYPHFTLEESEASEGLSLTCPRSHSQ